HPTTSGLDFDDADRGRRRLLLVVHDALRHGAQLNALSVARSLHDDYDIALEIVLLGTGPLWSEFERYGRVHDFARQLVEPQDRLGRLRRLRSIGVDAALCNTTV